MTRLPTNQCAIRSIGLTCLLPLISLFSTANVIGQETTPKWTLSTGKTLDAEFVRLTDDGVILKQKSTGKQAEIAMPQLSLESQLQAIKLARPEEFSKPVPKAELAPVVELPPAPEVSVDSVMNSPFTESQSLDEFVATIGSELDGGNTFVVWHALPDKMQESVKELMVKAMAKVGKQPIVQIKTLMKNLNTIVAEKKDFILGNKILAPDKKTREAIYSFWPVVERFVGSMSEESLWQADNFQEENIERWLAQFLVALGSNQSSIDAFVKSIGMPPQPKFADALKVTASADAKGKVEIANPQMPMLPPQEVVFRKVRGQWVAPAWMNPMRDGVNAALEGLDTVQDDQVRSTIQAGLIAVIPTVGALARAETQEEFDEIIAALEPLINNFKAGVESGMSQAAQAQAAMAGGAPGGRGAGPGGRGTGAGPGGNRGGGDRGGGLGRGN
ncbi:MAG: hypothetical protein AB8B50_12460 [Pirellulaceae bacterium]